MGCLIAEGIVMTLGTCPWPRGGGVRRLLSFRYRIYLKGPWPKVVVVAETPRISDHFKLKQPTI